AVLTPGPLKHVTDEDGNHFHVYLAHAHASVLKVTGKQYEVRLAGELFSCSAYSRAKGSRAPTPHNSMGRATRLLERVHIDAAGPYLTSL
ncbi:unnamed protein product, partial [Ascophyllum nodosum]